jgi:hypothetical protein
MRTTTKQRPLSDSLSAKKGITPDGGQQSLVLARVTNSRLYRFFSTQISLFQKNFPFVFYHKVVGKMKAI